MSTNKSTNLNLHLWEPEDDFLRTEFNENFEAIDGAVQGEKTAREAAVQQEREARISDMQEVRASISSTGGNASQAVNQLRAELTAELAGVKAKAEAAYGPDTPPFVLGSYTGDGNYGLDHIRKVELDFSPRLVIVAGNNGSLVAAPRNLGSCGKTEFSWGDRSVSWFAFGSAADHMNVSNKTYFYAIFR